MNEQSTKLAPTWREDIDSLAFYPSQHNGSCVIHRLAFRSLLGFAPTRDDCANYFSAHRELFEHAAQAKILRKNIAGDASFHLNSRDLKRQLLVVGD
jgi:hypothetical protein